MITETNILENFALVSGDTRNDCRIGFNGEVSDCTSFMSWQWLLQGTHFSYDDAEKNTNRLLDFKVVMFSGNPGYFTHLYSILKRLNNRVITIFLPEWDVSLYDKLGINSFSRIIYDTMNLTDVIFSMEEDKVSYYKAISNSYAAFVHVPIDSRMESGEFRISIEQKKEYILVYGDNNPNCPVTAFSIIGKLKKPIITVCIDKVKVDDLDDLFSTETKEGYSKLGQYPFLRLLGGSYLHYYPTRCIGSSREVVSCALAGTPCIGSDKSHTQIRLFPKLACDIYDVEKMVELGKKLYSDKEFYKEIVDFAWKEVSFYNKQNTIKRFINACNKGEEYRNVKLLRSNK